MTTFKPVTKTEIIERLRNNGYDLFTAAHIVTQAFEDFKATGKKQGTLYFNGQFETFEIRVARND